MRKRIVVTGGTKGIGRAILEKFASQGFDVATCARNENDLALLQQDIKKKFNVDADIHKADMSKKEDVIAFTHLIASQDRQVDVLVNNAGYFVPGSVVEEADGVLEDMMNSNLFSAYHTTRGLIKAVRDAKGHIFNICSIASIMAYPNGGSYAITKFALLGFSKVLREELKTQDVRVTAVLPGATRTASWDGVALPDERFMRSEDVADAVWGAYSLSPRSVVEEILIRPQLGDI